MARLSWKDVLKRMTGVVAAVATGACLLSVGVTEVAARPEAAEQVFADSGVIALADAAARGDAAEIGRLVELGVDANAVGAEGLTPLHWALLNRSADGMRALLDAGGDPGIADEGGRSVLHYAVLAEDPRYLKLLLERGADPDPVNPRTGYTPLFEALGGHRPEHVKALLAAGARVDIVADLGDTALHVAAARADYDAILILLQHGVDPQLRNAQHATFQRYLAIAPPEAVLGEAGRVQREAIRSWLRAHGLPVEF